MTINYNRTNFYCFFQLSDIQQAEVLKKFNFSVLDAEETEYAIFEVEDIPLPLSAFLWNREKLSGIICVSKGSAYYLQLSKYGLDGVIAYKHI